jgi:flagellar biogenesis protein FliO
METMQNGLGAVLVLALLGATLWWLRSRGLAQFALKLPQGGQRIKRMKTLERLSLTPHHSLHLVQVEGRTVLIAASPGGCSILDGPAAVEAAEDRTVSR